MVASEPGLKTGAIRRARGFYARALSEAEQQSLAEALQLHGLDEEIALIRLRLQQALKEQPEDFELMLKGTALLARLVATKFGLSKADAADLKAAIDYAVESLSEIARTEAGDD